MTSKNTVKNEMIIICKDFCDLIQRIFSPDKFFNEIKEFFVRYYFKDLKEKTAKIKSDHFYL